MVFALATTVSQAAPVTSGQNLQGQVILWTFIVAGLIFVIFSGVRAAMGKISFAPDAPHPLPDSEESPALKDSLDSPPLPDGDPYKTPEYRDSSEGVRKQPALGPRYFKVPTWPYKLYDLPLIGLVFLLYLALTGGGGGGGESIPIEQKFTPQVLVASIFFQLLLMGMACSFVFFRIKQSEWLGLRWKQWWLAFGIAPVTVLFIWIVLGTAHFSGWNGWLERTLGIESMQESVKLLQEAKDPLVIILMAVAAVVVAPLAEEVLFRGYLYPAAKRFCGPLGAMLFSSLVFAAAHGNAVALLPLFILAMLLCLIYELTGSIWATISVHFLFNAATVALQLLARYGVVDMSNPPT